MMIEQVVRDADEYERSYLHFSTVTCGFYSFNHVLKAEFFTRVLKIIPILCIYPGCFGWIGRGSEERQVPRFATTVAWAAIPEDVVHTFWVKYKGGLALSRADKRGAFPVTALMVENVSPSFGGHGLDERWEGDRRICAAYSDRSPAGVDIVVSSCKNLLALGKNQQPIEKEAERATIQ